VRLFLLSLLLTFTSTASAGNDVRSAYSTLDWESDCTVLDRPAEGEPGAWVSMVCNGYRGYPVFYSEDDLRVSLVYGFPDRREGQVGWQSFASFNRVSTTIEWRLAAGPGQARPFATIHRWFIHAGDNQEAEVLVVNRVAQPRHGRGCVAGYVEAAANPDANTIARRVADEIARTFRCGRDEPAWHGATTDHTPKPTA